MITSSMSTNRAITTRAITKSVTAGGAAGTITAAGRVAVDKAFLGGIPTVGLIFLVVLFLGGCRDSQEKHPSRADGGVTIGFSVATDTFVIERWNKDIKIFSSAAGRLGAEVLLQTSAGGAQAQISQIRYLLDQDIDVLVVLPHDTAMLAGVVRLANERRIPVISYDRLIQGVPVSAYVSFDNEEVGRLFGRALVEAVPRGNYLVVNGAETDNNSYLLNRGLFQILEGPRASGEISVVDEIWLQAWSSDEATERIRQVLDRTTDIDAIAAGNDQVANAAIQLLAERRMAGRVAVVGQDADLLSCQRVVEGLQLMTVYKPIQKLATRAAALAVDLAGGVLPEPDRYMDNGSGQEIPFFVEMPRAVFRHNMDETVIRDGFHSREAVYRTATGQK
ncbi:sugar ABC transporter substrate-binding protein [Alkalispirochaeta sphaeroplastigenens]|uniref:Sugar ABC transporter substrate-binding protein n=1 Tax=Alkalispirochaeta sphaeroplastigenens TaxID=1187066 RepID=A0A2S4JX52_9SPIO|nr:substrate-binding domain-containing protein [Alkalispirochaeta sphaeroplastigenens]POR04105.1 sugar ABC transporter substrate-binding protein [Alkalispirochaeta sphaeroplastigenens]